MIKQPHSSSHNSGTRGRHSIPSLATQVDRSLLEEALDTVDAVLAPEPAALVSAVVALDVANNALVDKDGTDLQVIDGMHELAVIPCPEVGG